MQRRSFRRASRLRLRPRRGLSVVEVLVALVVMAVGMTGMAGMLVQAARTATQMATMTGRAATETQQLNRIAALPYDSLASEVGCVTVNTQPFPHTRCIVVTDVGGGLGATQVRLIITPLDGKLRADTTYLTRSEGVPTNPLTK